MGTQKESAIVQALTKRSTDADFRWQLYDNIREEIVDRIFFEKNADVPHWYYTHSIPVKYEHEIEDFQFYSQQECCVYICKELTKMGLFAKTMENASKVFVSWHPKHLRQSQEEERLRKDREKTERARRLREERENKLRQKEIQLKKEADAQWERVSTKAKIQLSGGKQNLASNRVKLANFFLAAQNR